MTDRLNDRPRGVLETGPAEGVFQHERHRPAPDLAGFIEHFWLVAWDVAGEPVVREVLSHPSVHVVVEAGSSRIVGVPRGRFTRRLEGKGFVVGTKFRPGAFRPLVAFPIARLTDQIVALDRVFGARSDELERTVLAAPTIAGRIDAATRFFRSVLPPRDPVADEVAAIVKRILDDREIRRVDDVARIAGTSPRALQRLFHDYVGVSPKMGDPALSHARGDRAHGRRNRGRLVIAGARARILRPGALQQRFQAAGRTHTDRLHARGARLLGGASASG